MIYTLGMFITLVFSQSLVIQLGVKECIVPVDEAQRDYELLKLRSVLEKCGVVMTERRKSNCLILVADCCIPYLRASLMEILMMFSLN